VTSGAGASSRTPAATQDEVRRHNLARLLRLVHVHGALSRSELAAQTGLNRSTVRTLTTALARCGLVRETHPPGRGYAGRPSIVVEPESRRVFALALDIGAEHVIAARIGLGGLLLDRREVRQPRGAYEVAPMIGRLCELLAEVGSAAPPDALCVGLGVGVCGVVRPEDGMVRYAPNLDWVDVPLGLLLAKELGGDLPVAVRNEADLGVKAEHVRGVATGVRDVIYLSGEVGVGGGIILSGRPLTGVGGYAGEIGHMGVNPRGRRCRCGRRGCWETEVGEDAVLLATGAPPGMELADVLLAHAAGAPWTRAGIRQVGHWLGVGIANLVNIFNPAMIVFGGATRGLFPVTETTIREVLRTALAAPRSQVLLTLPSLGADSAVFGAAELVLDPVLDHPFDAPQRRPATSATSAQY
jgi:predicted NBD/HSP70 family sugar kinase